PLLEPYKDDGASLACQGQTPGLWWVSERLYSGDYATEGVAHLARDAFEPRVADAPHCDHRIDRRHLDLAVLETLHDDVAGQHDADVRLFAERLEGVIRVAGAEDAVGPKVLADLRLQRSGDVDLGKNAETFALER